MLTEEEKLYISHGGRQPHMALIVIMMAKGVRAEQINLTKKMSQIIQAPVTHLI
jgi:hypothetical protein